MRAICLPLFLFCFASALPLAAQNPDDVQRLVEKLYPKNTRLKEIRMGEIVREMGIHEGGQVADVGCGTGDFSILLSHVVGPQGKVYCEDVTDGKQGALPRARANVKKQKVKNVAVIHGEADNPKLPAGALDAVLIVNAYHEMAKYESMLRHIRESLRPGGRLVILDNRPCRTAERPREKQTKNHVLSATLAAGELQAADFHIVDRQDAFIDNPDAEDAHWLMAAERR